MISGNLSEKYEVVIYANYLIKADVFAEKSEHHFDGGTVIKEPTCTMPGEKTFKCTDSGCHFEKTVSIPALGHNFVDGKCTREGCGATKLPDHVHKYILEKPEDAFKIKPATCTLRRAENIIFPANAANTEQKRLLLRHSDTIGITAR